jgi:phage-related protein
MREVLLDKEDIEKISKVVAETLRKSAEVQINVVASAVSENSRKIARAIVDIAIDKRSYLYVIEAIREEEAIKKINLDLVSSAIHGLTDPIGQLADWISTQLSNLASIIYNSITSWIINSSLWNSVMYISNAISSIISNISNISGVVSNILSVVSNLPSIIYSTISSISTSINSLISATSSIYNIVTMISSSISSLVSTLSSTISGIGTSLSGLPAFLNNIKNAFISYANSVSDFLSKTLPTYFMSITEFFSKTLPNYFNYITTFFTKTLPSYFDKINEFFNRILPTYLTNVSKFFSETIPSYLTTISKFFLETLPTYFSIVTKFFAETLPNQIGVIIKFFTETLPSYFVVVSKFFTETLPNWILTISKFFTEQIPKWIDTLSKFFYVDLPKVIDNVKVFVSTLIELPTKVPEIIHNIAMTIWKHYIEPTYDTVYNEVKQKIIDPTLDKLKELSDNIVRFGVTFQGFVNATNELPRNLKTMILELPDAIWDKVSEYIPHIKDAWRKFVDELANVVTNIAKTIYEKIMAFSSWLYDSFTSALTTIVSTIESTVLNAITFVAERSLEAIKLVVQKILDFATKIGADIGKLITAVSVLALTPIYDTFAKWSISEFDMLAKKSLEAETPIENVKYAMDSLKLIATDIVGVHYLAWGTSFALHRFASFCETLEPNVLIELESEGGCAVEPAGIGARIRELLGFMMSLGWRIKPAWMFREIAKDVRELSDTFTRGLMYGLTIWMTNPIVRLLNAAFRDILVVELPPIQTMQEIVRRHMATNQFDDVMKRYIAFLKLYGYRTEIIKWITDPNIKIDVVDRFGTKRTIPLALIYEMPSASDVARMAIRDIFGMGADAVSAFLKVYSARGMYPDIGVLYYLLHYRYPPPERLWTFTTRAISGLLWATITSDMKDKIKAEANALGAVEPTDARYWNFRAKEVFSALQTYMTWHDFARFSWIRKEMLNLSANFTSDNQIIIDTLADIPTKIDQRWMIKWGLYEHLSTKGVTINSEVKEFATRVLEGNPVSGIKMDITNFSRTLQATGLHPDWIPLTAVAETMNMLTEERTLLRTGFMNLFKEGFYDWKALEKLLAGFIKASFYVAYFDSEKMTWTTGWINLPVMFLPPERRLLELRALMDRALDILREIQRDITVGYQEFIIDSYDEYKARLTKVIDSINEFYTKDYRNITESDLPDELKLKFVEDYYKPYVKALDIWRDVYTIRRMRTWASRWLGWVIYRMAFGYVSKEDVKKVLEYTATACKLAPKEVEFIGAVMELLSDIAKRDTASEYLPTPTTMATLSEYITLDANVVDQVLIDRGIPDYWRQVWLTYISLRPIKSDASTLLSTYIRAFRYGVVSKIELDTFINSLTNYGFTKREIEIKQKIADLEELILQAKENMQQYIPTPIMLASICEYLPEARDYFDDVVKARRIPQSWAELWATYIDIRPLVDDMKRYLARAEDLYARFMIDKNKFDGVLNEVAGKLGYTPKEIEFLRKVTEFERYKNAWIELIGTVNRLVELSEYSPTASNWALGKLYVMIDALPLSDDEKNKLKTMWEEYIRNRPVKSEAKMYITQLINAYVDGIISDTDFDKELQSMKKWGFSDTELQFYKQIAVVRRARKLKIPLVYGE